MRLLAMFVLIAAFGAGVGAQQPGGGRQGRGPGISPAEIHNIFDGYLLAQAQDALGLTDQQFAQVVPRLRALQDVRRRHQVERTRLLMELQRLTRGEGGRANEASIRDRLAKLQENDVQLADDLRRAYASLDEVLDLRQQARFRVFEEQIERKKLELLMRARQNRMVPKRQPPGR
jgi:hypothetical protein